MGSTRGVGTGDRHTLKGDPLSYVVLQVHETAYQPVERTGCFVCYRVDGGGVRAVRRGPLKYAGRRDRLLLLGSAGTATANNVNTSASNEDYVAFFAVIHRVAMVLAICSIFFPLLLSWFRFMPRSLPVFYAPCVTKRPPPGNTFLTVKDYSQRARGRIV